MSRVVVRKARRAGRKLFGHSLMSIWVVLPLFPVLAAVASWWLGIE